MIDFVNAPSSSGGREYTWGVQEYRMWGEKNWKRIQKVLFLSKIRESKYD